ncbi:hypothetical protein EV421DRAFT_1896121 [Armillaria borealis]|uniref:Uncharacterized protein n=1 Tax=Armillaria borealis TaxID=47425 RepID=A0AA39K9E4_9AGAR|nr:hypothetical protein EV421DRAFT_1896121 [Armillaria borealis]
MTLHDQWYHAYQVKDYLKLIAEEEGTWCFLLADKDDDRFIGKIYSTWYARDCSIVVHFTTPGHLVFASGFVLSQYHIETYGVLAPRWRVYSLTSDGYHILQFNSLYWMYRRIEDAHNEACSTPKPDVNLLRFTDDPLVHDETTYYIWPSGSSIAPEWVDIAVGTAMLPVTEEISGPGPTAEPSIPLKQESPLPNKPAASRSATASDCSAQDDLSVQNGRERSSPSSEDIVNNGSTSVNPGAYTSTAGPGSVNQKVDIILRYVRQLQMIASWLQMIVAEESSTMEVEASA